MELSKVSTKDLVEELKKREGVEAICIEPYEDYRISWEGESVLFLG